jgi:hypothetical protein
MAVIKPHSKALREFYFWSGIIATFCYRIIVVLNNYSTYWSTISWYVGTVGFIVYFAHRFEVSEKRYELLVKYKILNKIKRSKEFSAAEKEASDYVLGTLLSTKERWNFIFIFVASTIALIWGAYLDFWLKK